MKEKIITLKVEWCSAGTMVSSIIRAKSNEKSMETVWC